MSIISADRVLRYPRTMSNDGHYVAHNEVRKYFNSGGSLDAVTQDFLRKVKASKSTYDIKRYKSRFITCIKLKEGGILGRIFNSVANFLASQPTPLSKAYHALQLVEEHEKKFDKHKRETKRQTWWNRLTDQQKEDAKMRFCQVKGI